MTEKLYDKDAYGVEFDAKVLQAQFDGENTLLVLDRTLFFPDEGGQSPDRGTINGCAVLDVQHKGDDIFHLVKGEFAAGTEVHGIIDWDFRFRNMQMHSGEHIFSGTVFRRFGFHNVGFHLSGNSATMDFSGKLTAEEIRSVEDDVNRIISENRAIRARYPEPEELEKLEYRSKKELTGPVRLVEIEGTDLCACCATHVHSTAEIGCFLVTSFENYKGGVRLHFLAGLRALSYINDCRDTLTDISRMLSVKTEAIGEGVAKLFEEAKQLRYRLLTAERENISGKLHETYLTDGGDATAVQPLNRGKALFLQIDSSLLRYTMDEMKRYYNGQCAVFTEEGERFRYLIESSTESLAPLQQRLRTELGAKGGGSERSVSGSIAAEKEAILQILEEYGCN